MFIGGSKTLAVGKIVESVMSCFQVLEDVCVYDPSQDFTDNRG